MPNDKELKHSQSKADLYRSQQIKKESILRFVFSCETFSYVHLKRFLLFQTY